MTSRVSRILEGNSAPLWTNAIVRIYRVVSDAILSTQRWSPRRISASGDRRLSEWIFLLVSLLLIAACGAFVAAEFAFVTVDRAAVDRAAAEGDVASQGVQTRLKRSPLSCRERRSGSPLRTSPSAISPSPPFRQLIDGPLKSAGVPTDWVDPVALGIGLAIGTLLTMIFGELVPKNLALAKPHETARATQRFQRTFTTVMAWPIRLLNGSANAIVRRFGIEPQEELRSARSSTELASLIQRSADLGTLDAETAELVERSVEFGSRTAGEIMTPRVRTSSVEDSDRVIRVIELARETGHSRFPVLDSDDVTVGTVHVKHAVAVPVAERTSTRIKHIMVRPTVVPDSLRLGSAARPAAPGRLPDGGRPGRVRRPGRDRDFGRRRRGDRR